MSCVPLLMPLDLLWGAHKSPKSHLFPSPQEGQNTETSQGLPAQGRCLDPVTFWEIPWPFICTMYGP